MVCPICYDEVVSNSVLIKCQYCNKYIGHLQCAATWIQKNKHCPICREWQPLCQEEQNVLIVETNKLAREMEIV
jgi:hypothetical protein